MKKLWLNVLTVTCVSLGAAFSAGAHAGDHHRDGWHDRDDWHDRHEWHEHRRDCDDWRGHGWGRPHDEWREYRSVYYRPAYYRPAHYYSEPVRYERREYDDDLHGSISVNF